MSTIIMQMTIPHKPLPTNFLSTFDRKASKRCCTYVSSSAAATGLKPCFSQRHDKPYDQILTTRRSGNYKPPLWDYDYIQSLSSPYREERYLSRAFELKVKVLKMLLEEEMHPVRQLELIDDLQRMGISYHFEDKINDILNCIHQEYKYCKKYEAAERDLYSTALGFRLLRQHGFKVSQEVFDCFKNEKGDFKLNHSDDTKGLLELYEASYLLTNGEKTLELAREFATSFLQKKIDEGNGMDEDLSLSVRHALELPIHWRIQRPNARWFIDAYARRPGMNPTVLELAKLDYNIVQATHQEEIKHLGRWWKKTSLAEKLPFARDRLVECYLLTIGLFEPQHGYSRIIGTKVNALVTIIDDMFDVYGTMEELLLFNNAIQRWDIEAMDQLPNYMQMCFLALNNFINDMAYDVLNEQGFPIILYLRKSWADLCRTYLQESKWYSEGYKPRLEEYISNAWISISVPVMLSHAFFALTNPIEKEAVQSLYHQYHKIVQYSGTIARLANDLGTSPDEMKRGDVPKSIQCYMNERGADSEEAREYVKILISETWKKMNEELVADSPFPQNFVRCAVDFGRIAHYIYQDGDGHGIQNSQVMNRISSLLFEPIV